MKYFFLFITFFLVFSCTKKLDENRYNTFSEDSEQLFFRVEELGVKNQILKNDSITIKIESISEQVFLKALQNNFNNVRYFTKDKKVNELNKYRKGDTLIFDNKLSATHFVDKITKRPLRYFLSNKIGDLFIVKKRHFEDYETFFYNNKTQKKTKSFLEVSSSLFSNKKIFFYSNTIIVSPLDSLEIGLIRIDSNKTTQIFKEEVKWFTHFSFFDEDSSVLYFIYDFYDDGGNLRSTYAKLTIEETR